MRSPRPPRCALWRRLPVLLLVSATSVTLASCQFWSSRSQVPTSASSTSIPAPAGTAAGGPAAPSADAIVSVDDYRLQPGIGVFRSPDAPPTGGHSLALDDLTDDVYFLGVPTDPTSGKPTQDRPDGVYRYDLATRQAMKIAEPTLGPKAELLGIAATDGWVFWEEYSESVTDRQQQVHKMCRASRSDGSQLTTLLDRSVTGAADEAIAPTGCGFSAGGGAALWFDDPDRAAGADDPAGAGVAFVFDTESTTSKQITPVPVAEGMINGDSVGLPGEWTDRPPAFEVFHPSTGQRTAVAASADQFALSASGVAWITQTDTTVSALGCLTDAAAPTTPCERPVQLGTWPSPLVEGTGLVGLAGRYAVINPPSEQAGEPANTVLIDLAEPTTQVELPGEPRQYVIGGNRLADVWSSRVGGDSSDKAPAALTYLRVISLG